MTDGMNHVRAIRLAEIIQEFRSIQYHIAQIRVTPSAEEYYGEGYMLLRQCASEGQAVLKAPFIANPNTSPNGDPEEEKAQLQRVLIDASTRRFQAQRIYLRATAAMRWVNSRNAVLAGQRPTTANAPALQEVDAALRAVGEYAVTLFFGNREGGRFLLRYDFALLRLLMMR